MNIDPLLLNSLVSAAETAKATAEACLTVFEQLRKEVEENQWVSLNDASAALGPGISAEMLKERCLNGRFKHGVHFINTSDGERSHYLIKVAAVRKVFETDPAKRHPLNKSV